MHSILTRPGFRKDMPNTPNQQTFWSSWRIMFTICKFSNHFRVSSFVGLVHGPGFVSIPDFVISIKLAKRGQLNSSQNRDSDDEPGTAHLPMVNFVIFCFKFPWPRHNCLDFDCIQIPAMNQLHPPMVPSSLLCFSLSCMPSRNLQ